MNDKQFEELMTKQLEHTTILLCIEIMLIFIFAAISCK